MQVVQSGYIISAVIVIVYIYGWIKLINYCFSLLHTKTDTIAKQQEHELKEKKQNETIHYTEQKDE